MRDKVVTGSPDILTSNQYKSQNKINNK